MIPTLPGRALWLALAITATTAASAQAQFDTVFGSKGTPDKGTVTRMSPTKVEIDVAGRAVTHEVKDIRKITYAEDPAELQNARDAAMAGQYEQALAEINKINPNSLTRSVVKEDVIYYKAYAEAKMALEGRGDKTAAGKALLAFVNAYPQSYHFYEANEIIGDLLAAVENYAAAAAFYGKLGQSGWPDYVLRSNVLVAQTLVNQGKYKEAAAHYDAVMANALNTPEANRMKLLATVGKAKCLAEGGAPDQAVTMIESIIANNDPKDAELFGRAYNALGDAYRVLNKPEDALLAYLHTDVLFYSNGEAHAEALYRLVKLWTDQNQNDRATTTRNLLKSRYANSRWASQN